MVPRLGVLALTLAAGVHPAMAAVQRPDPLGVIAAATLTVGQERPALDLLPSAQPLVAWLDEGTLRLTLVRLSDLPEAAPGTPQPRLPMPDLAPTTTETSPVGQASSSPAATLSATASPLPPDLPLTERPGPAGVAPDGLRELAFAGPAESPWLVAIRQAGREGTVEAWPLGPGKVRILQRSPGTLDRLTTAVLGRGRTGALWRVRLGQRRVALVARSWSASDSGRLRWLAHTGQSPEQPILLALPDRWLAAWRSVTADRAERILAATWQESQALPLTVPLAEGQLLLGPVGVDGSQPPLAGWQGSDPIGRQLHLRRLGQPGPRWHADLRTDLSMAGPDMTRVGCDGRGRLLVAWSQRTHPSGENQALMARLHGPDGDATSAPILIDGNSGDLKPLALKAVGNRQWLVGWGRREDDGWSIRLALLSGEGSR